MRAVLFVVTIAVLGCSAPSAPAPSPVVGHVRMHGRVIDLTVDQFDTRTATELHELRHATAQHEVEVLTGAPGEPGRHNCAGSASRTTPIEVWADVNARELRFARD